MSTKTFILLVITITMPILVGLAFYYGFQLYFEVIDTIINPIHQEPIYEKPENTLLGWRIITAYSSCPEETDDTPFITASGQRVRDGIVATNELPIGTKIIIEGLGEFEVQDRTNKRYDYRIDIWMPSKQEAIEFGRRTMEVYALEI